MPTYDFKCPNGHAFERFYKKISDAPSEGEVTCPECGAVAERQLSGGGGLVFKGSGFYLTDYGKNAHRKPEPKVDAGKAEGTKSEGTKSEGTKPDTTKADSAKPTPERSKPKAEGPPAKPKKE